MGSKSLPLHMNVSYLTLLQFAAWSWLNLLHRDTFRNPAAKRVSRAVFRKLTLTPGYDDFDGNMFIIVIATFQRKRGWFVQCEGRWLCPNERIHRILLLQEECIIDALASFGWEGFPFLSDFFPPTAPNVWECVGGWGGLRMQKCNQS